MIYTFRADQRGGRGPLFTAKRPWVARSLREDYRTLRRYGVPSYVARGVLVRRVIGRDWWTESAK